MKKAFRIMGIFLMVLAIFALPGCGNYKEDEPDYPTYPTNFQDRESFIGKWRLEKRIGSNGDLYSPSQAEQIEFKADGTFVVYTGLSGVINGTWTYDGAIVGHTSFYGIEEMWGFNFFNYPAIPYRTEIDVWRNVGKDTQYIEKGIYFKIGDWK